MELGELQLLCSAPPGHHLPVPAPQIITQSVRPTSRAQLLVAVCGLTFAMSSVLDNLTTTIVSATVTNGVQLHFRVAAVLRPHL